MNLIFSVFPAPAPGDRPPFRLVRALCGSIALLFLCLAAFPAAGQDAIPEGEGQAETFLVISDAHMTAEAPEEMTEAVVRAARGRDAVIMLGDNTNNSHAGEHALVLGWARSIEQRTGAKVYIIPGNHDYGIRMGLGEFALEYGAFGRDRAFSRDPASAGCAVMTEKGTCLLLLDTNRLEGDGHSPADGGISAETLEWVREVLDSLPDGTCVLACGHHPILPEGRNRRTPGAGELSRLLAEYGAGLYLCGHDHGFALSRQEALLQITVGQPQAFPGWVGIAEREKDGFSWHTEQIYDPTSPYLGGLRDNALELGRAMARGALSPTPYADDEAAVEWFAAAFMRFAACEMTPESCRELLADENCAKWRTADTRTVVKDWILGLLENCPEDVRSAFIPLSLKKSPSGDVPPRQASAPEANAHILRRSP